MSNHVTVLENLQVQLEGEAANLRKHAKDRRIFRARRNEYLLIAEGIDLEVKALAAAIDALASPRARGE